MTIINNIFIIVTKKILIFLKNYPINVINNILLFLKSNS